MTTAQRRDAHDVIDARLDEWASARKVDDAVAELQALGIAAGALATVDEISTHPQLVARGYNRFVQHPVVGRRRVAHSPVTARYDGATAEPAPTLGQHNRPILTDLGLSPDAIDELYAKEVCAERLL
jgi:crotonobetainyl-CoA:carnitine CoA-transferase CaiB-like acyl-CoA transferase